VTVGFPGLSVRRDDFVFHLYPKRFQDLARFQVVELGSNPFDDADTFFVDHMLFVFK